uniref:Uncharacterized protein n=1 Tax=Anguilla anguilla TaxID=7936 RepID=A0A0E9Q1D7_ANGAN
MRGHVVRYVASALSIPGASINGARVCLSWQCCLGAAMGHVIHS